MLQASAGGRACRLLLAAGVVLSVERHCSSTTVHWCVHAGRRWQQQYRCCCCCNCACDVRQHGRISRITGAYADQVAARLPVSRLIYANSAAVKQQLSCWELRAVCTVEGKEAAVLQQ
jgi:hypothetical protein